MSASISRKQFGPDHFNNILNTSFKFTSDNGKTFKTNVYEAAKIAKSFTGNLPKCQIVVPKSDEKKNIKQLEHQHVLLTNLIFSIKFVLAVLKNDSTAFQQEEIPPAGTRVISTINDVKRVSEELDTLARIISNDSLIGEIFSSNFPEFLYALEKVSQKV